MLCVIDMQSCFDTAFCPSTIASVQKLMRKARQKNEHICIVEYMDDDEVWMGGETLSQVMDELDGYQNWGRCGKWTDGGGDEIVEYMGLNNLLNDNIDACGVNWQFCVYRTLQQLREKLPNKIRVFEKACNGPAYGNWNYYLRTYRKLGIIVNRNHVNE